MIKRKNVENAFQTRCVCELNDSILVFSCDEKNNRFKFEFYPKVPDPLFKRIKSAFKHIVYSDRFDGTSSALLTEANVNLLKDFMLTITRYADSKISKKDSEKKSRTFWQWVEQTFNI